MGYKGSLVVLCALVSSMATALVNPDTKILFVPVGFDDNDEVVVVADGYLQSSCLRTTAPLVKPDLQAKRIVVQARAKRIEGECKWDFRVPFTTVIPIGTLPVGTYTITTEDGKVSEKLTIVKSTVESIDNFMYAPVDRAFVRANQEGKFEAVVEGRFSNTCFRVSDMKLSHSGKTLELLPVMDRQDGECEGKETPFVAKKELPELMPGRYLLHVRSLNGQSANDVFSNIWVH